MGLGFKGDVVDFYDRYRRGYPAPVVEALAAALHLEAADVVLDLGCGTGQLTLPVAARVRAVIGMDPEPDMLERAREVAQKRHATNVTWILGADTDVPALGSIVGAGALGAVTVGQALHWMNPRVLFGDLVPYLRPGGGIAVVTNGKPAWMQDNAWSRALRGFLEGWLGEPMTSSCGSDASTQQRYASDLREVGLAVTETSLEYEDTVDFEHLIGALYSAFPIDKLPAPDDRAAFADQVRAALPSADSYTEFVRVAMLIGTKT